MRVESHDSREDILDVLEKKDAVRGLIHLALILDDQGFPKDAEDAYKNVIEKKGAISGQKDQVILFCQRKISSLLRQRGLYSEAEDQCKRVLELSIAATGPKSSLSLQAAGDLAILWRDQGNLDSAFTKIRDVLDNETCSPYQDILHVRLVSILAIVLRDCGHYDLSLFLTRNTLRVSDALIGNKHPFTLDLASELSQTLNEMGLHRLAEEFAERALDGFAKKFGKDHPQSLKAASRLANAIRFNERLGDATHIFERTLKAQKSQLGSSHPDTVLTKCGLAATYALGARFRDSVSILREVLAQQNAVFGQRSHPESDWTMQAIGRIRAFQRALITDSISDNEFEEESRRMDDFLRRPFHNDRRNLQLWDTIAFTHKSTEELRSQSDLQRLAAANDVKNDPCSSSDKAPVSGFFGTILHVACFEGNFEFVQTWLSSGKDIHVEGGIFETPLCAASYGGHIDIVDFLLKNHANVKDPGRYGFSALQSALNMGHNDVAVTLLKAGANLEVSDHWYGNALHEAAMTGEESMVNLLLEAKANPNCVTGLFGTALGAADWKENPSIVKALKENGAIIEAQVEETTALKFANSIGNQDPVKVLKWKADNSKEALGPKESSETLKKQFLEPDKAFVEESKKKEQSEPLKQEPLKRHNPPKPQTQRLPNYHSPEPSKHSLSSGSGKTEGGKKKAKFRSLARSVTSATKGRLSSTDNWIGRFRVSAPMPRKGISSR